MKRGADGGSSLGPLLWLTVSSVMGALVWVAIPAAMQPVAAPALALTVLAGLALTISRSRDGSAGSLFEIGTFFTLVVALYGTYPLLGYILSGGAYGPDNDGRLYFYQPLPHEMGTIGWYYVGFLGAFLAAYLAVRGPGGAPVKPAPGLDTTTLLTIVSAYVLVTAFLTLVRLTYDLSASTYAESYLVHKRLPLMLQQLAGHLGGARFTLEVLILLALFRHYRRHRALIAVWIGAVAASTFVRLGSRTDLALLVLSALMVYDATYRRIRLGRFAAGAVAGVALFLALGVLREGTDATRAARRSPFQVNNEFEVVFANVYDLRERQAQGLVERLGPEFYWSDFLALVPQQLVPVPKVSPALWYAETFYPSYAATGMTFAFGIVPQSMLGAGWPELLARGIALGLIFGLLHRRFVRRPPTVWSLAYYVFLTALSYLSFRLTSFHFVVLSFYRFLLPVLGLQLLTALIRRAPSRSAS